jgi:hypothetical protein
MLRRERWVQAGGCGDYAMRVDQALCLTQPCDEQINKDVSRALSTLRLSGLEQAALRRVLLALSRELEAVGYCQGMNVLAAAALHALEFDEEAAFYVVRRLVLTRESCFGPSMAGLLRDQAVVSDLLAFWTPDVLNHMLARGVDIGSIVGPWMLCLFVEAPLRLDHALRVWDWMFSTQASLDLLPFALVIATIQLAAKKMGLLELSSQEEILRFFLHDIKDKITESDLQYLLDTVIHILFLDSNKVENQVRELREFHQEEVISELRRSNREIRRAKLSFSGLPDVNSDTLASLWSRFIDLDPWNAVSFARVSQQEGGWLSFPQFVCSEVTRSAPRASWMHKLWSPL